MADPFSQVFSGIWQLLLNNTNLTNQVLAGNRIRLDQAPRNPTKEIIRTADVPELVLVPTGGVSNLHATSSTTTIQRNYDILLSTGDLRVNEALFPVQWEIVVALLEWKLTLGGLAWNGYAGYLSDLNLVNSLEIATDDENNRNLAGWSTVLTIETYMNFPTQLLRQ